LREALQPLGSKGATRIPNRWGEKADVIAIKHGEADAADGKIMPGGGHAEAGVDARQMLGGDGEIVIARQQERAVAKPVVNGKNRIEIFKTAIDDVAQRHDEGQIFAIEGIHRLRELFGTFAIMTAHLGTRIDIGILGIGDYAEGEERSCFFSHDAPR